MAALDILLPESSQETSALIRLALLWIVPAEIISFSVFEITSTAQILPEMEKDRKRWGVSLAAWEKEVEKLRAYVRDGARDQQVLADLKDYFDLTDAQMRNYFGT